MRRAGPKARRPSDVQQCGAAADPGRQAAGPSEQRAATTSPLGRSSTTKGSKRSADERSEAEAPNPNPYEWPATSQE